MVLYSLYGGDTLKENYLVTKSNKLISANYDLSLQEQKIILTLASMVQPKDEEFREYEFKIKDFINLLGIKDQSKYQEVPQITKELIKKVFEIREGNKIIQLSWLCSAIYEIGKGTVTLKFAPELKPYMLQLKEFYTSYKLNNVLELKSKYSIRIYEILKSHEYKKQGYIEIDLEELRKMVGANEKAYKTYANFKNKVILKAQEELQDKTDISFDFEEIKTGRKVTSIKFYIHSNTKANDETAITTDAEQEQLLPTDRIKQVQAIFKENITDIEAQKMYDAAGGNIQVIKDKYSIVHSMNNCKNVVGAMMAAIKENWTLKVSSRRPGGMFNNYDMRTYDIKELEKRLLGRYIEEDTE